MRLGRELRQDSTHRPNGQRCGRDGRIVPGDILWVDFGVETSGMRPMPELDGAYILT